MEVFRESPIVQYEFVLKEIENYQARNSEVLDSVGRYVRIYDPALRCENGSFLSCSQNGKQEIAKVIRQMGEQRFDLDLLGARLEKGSLGVELSDKEYSIEMKSVSMAKLRWKEGEPAKTTSFSIVDPVELGIAAIDKIAPIKRGATHLVFYQESRPIDFSKLVSKVTSFFDSSVSYCSRPQSIGRLEGNISFEDDSNELALDVFAAFTSGADLAWLDCAYAPELSQYLEAFEEARNLSTTAIIFIATDDEVFPIIESLNFGNVEAIWVIDEDGRLDPTRTRTRVLDGDSERAEIMSAIHQYKEDKFEADLLGEDFDQEMPFPEIWKPIF